MCGAILLVIGENPFNSPLGYTRKLYNLMNRECGGHVYKNSPGIGGERTPSRHVDDGVAVSHARGTAQATLIWVTQKVWGYLRAPYVNIQKRLDDISGR